MATKTIHSGYASGLTVGPSYTQVTVTSSGSVGGSGLVLEATGVSLSNYGLLEASTASGTRAVYLDFGGTVYNEASIYGFIGI